MPAYYSHEKQHKKLKVVRTPSFPKSYTQTKSVNDGSMSMWEAHLSVRLTVSVEQYGIFHPNIWY